MACGCGNGKEAWGSRDATWLGAPWTPVALQASRCRSAQQPQPTIFRTPSRETLFCITVLKHGTLKYGTKIRGPLFFLTQKYYFVPNS
jgi:hypothetical protein